MDEEVSGMKKYGTAEKIETEPEEAQGVQKTASAEKPWTPDDEKKLTEEQDEG